MDYFEEMINLYPKIILVSMTPSIWLGLLTVTNSHTNSEIKVKVKLNVPFFPRLDNASISFGGNIAFLFSINFKKQIDCLIKKSESVSGFFQELTSLLEKLFKEKQNIKVLDNSIHLDNREQLFKELSTVLSEYSDVEILSAKDLSTIKLTMSDISIIIQPTVTSAGQNSWKIISSDLLDLPGCTIKEKKTLTLKEIRKTFQKQVNMLKDAWDQLRKIDIYCCVIDPIDPKPYHMYRRIYLSPMLSFLLTLNPLDPYGFPNIKFLGAKREVEKYREIIQNEDATEKWDLEYSVYENLLTLLNIHEFPQALQNKETHSEEGMVGDEECCICFTLKMENNELPDEICSNQRCRRRFHSICLFQWLQELATNKIIFNKIFGPCPNCEEEVSCKVPSN